MSSGAETTTPLPAYVHAEQPVFYNVGAWLKENEEYFQPPVCNKMMHNYQLKVGTRLLESHFPIVYQKSLIKYPFAREKTSPISRLLLNATLSAFS